MVLLSDCSSAPALRMSTAESFVRGPTYPINAAAPTLKSTTISHQPNTAM
jgi:hypothetical protein